MKKLAVIFGGKSCESDISVLTAVSVYKSMKMKYRCMMILFKNGNFYHVKNIEKCSKISNFYRTKKPIFFEKNEKNVKFCFRKKVFPDCAVLCTHGGEGENGILQSILDSKNIPYTGSGIFSSALCIDKIYLKQYLEKFGYSVLPYRIFEEGDSLEGCKDLDFPVIVKPARLGSSIGISVATNLFELSQGLLSALEYDRRILIEKALLRRREYTCACFRDGNKLVVGDIEEVVVTDDFYSFNDKYKPQKGVERVYPAAISEATRLSIENTTKRLYEELSLRGVVRVDYLEGDGVVYVNEINTIPGSFSWYLFKNKGYNLLSIVDAMIEEGIKERRKENALRSCFDGEIVPFFPAKGSKTEK